MNALVLEDGDDAVLLDCGIMFPEEEVGIDVVHADFSYAVGLGQRLRAVVLTHGHEDHIGAIPFLLARTKVPVYGPAFALELVRARLTEHSLGFVPDLRVIKPREPFFAGSLEIEPIRVTHSIPDAVALAIRTSIGTVVHTGDFKVDLNPPDGRHFDLQRLSEYGAAGVTLLLSDSTNIGLEGITRGERAVADELDRTIQEAGSGRVFVAAFSSNVQRLQTVVECAERHGRNIVLAGRSVWRHVAAATGLGLFRLPAERLVAPERSGEVPRERLLVIVSGTQGEPRSGLARLSLGEHRHLRVEPGDLVVLTSRHIPGNEMAIARMIDNLARLGARVVHVGNRPLIHASGHAHREEQKLMIQLVRPRFFIPVHGTYQHLFDHARLAREMGISATMLLEDGQVAVIDEDGMSLGESVAVERVHRDGLAGVNPEVLRQRRALADGGLVNVFIVLDRDFRLLAEPRVICCGVLPEDDLEVVMPAASRRLREEIDAAPEGVRSQPDELRERCRRATRRFFDEAVGRRPIVLVNLTVVADRTRVSVTHPCNPPREPSGGPEEPSVDVGDGGKD
ncbi:MAG: ribonuclease J [Deltaproteobacteria bacterium]|nr:ribonuclease J [Deltaproteobacteria bacterium]